MNENIAVREAERNIIAGILSNRLNPSETGLTGLEFENVDFRNIFLASIEILKETNEVDILTVSNYLAENNEQKDLITPNPTVLATLASSHIPANLKPSYQILRANKLKTRLGSLGESLQAWSSESSEKASDIVERATAQLEQIKQALGQIENKRKHISEIVPQAVEIYQELYQGTSYNIPTGFNALDRATGGGGVKGDVWLLGSPTGTGKSALMLEMARRQSALGFNSLIFSREMSDIENFKRVHSAVGGVPLWTVRPFMHQNTLKNLEESLPQVAQQRIWFDSVSSDIESICREIESAVEEDNISTVYIDYLQLLEGLKGTKSNRYEEITYCSKRLKTVAMKTGVWIVEIAQYNRQANLTGQMENHSFDGSSQIEKDASIVIHLSLEDFDAKVEWRKGSIKTTKGRNAPLTSFDIWYKGETFTFTDENPVFGVDFNEHH